MLADERFRIAATTFVDAPARRAVTLRGASAPRGVEHSMSFVAIAKAALPHLRESPHRYVRRATATATASIGPAAIGSREDSPT